MKIRIDQKQFENVEYFNYLGSMITNDAICTREIKYRIAMAKAAFNKKKTLFTSKLELNLRKKLVKCYIWSKALYGAETWTLRKIDQRLATSWTVWGSNPGGGEIFRTRPDRPWVPSSLLYNGHRVSFPWVKRPGHGVHHPPPSKAEVKERVELYLYFPSGPSWLVLF
jgi:hypothetical protein